MKFNEKFINFKTKKTIKKKSTNCVRFSAFWKNRFFCIANSFKFQIFFFTSISRVSAICCYASLPPPPLAWCSPLAADATMQKLLEITQQTHQEHDQELFRAIQNCSVALMASERVYGTCAQGAVLRGKQRTKWPFQRCQTRWQQTAAHGFKLTLNKPKIDC